MTKDTKRELFIFSTFDNYPIKEHFERMARKGWLLESIKYNIAKYKRIAPQELVFSADIYPEISPLKRYVKKDTDYYINLCEDVGWNHITSLNNLHIFYSKKDENLVPVQTDEEYIEKILSKSITKELISLFIIFLAQLNLLRIMLPFEYTVLYSNVGLVNIFFIPMVILLLFFQIAGYVVWILKAKNSIKRRRQVPRGNYKIARVKGILLFGLSSIMVGVLVLAVILDSINGGKLYFLGFLPSVIGIIAGIIYNKKSQEKNVGLLQRAIISFVIVFASIAVIMPATFRLNDKLEDNNLPEGYTGLTLSDFGLIKEPQYKRLTRSGSVFVPRRSIYSERQYQDSIYTLHIQGRSPKIARYIFDELIKEELDYRYYREIISADNKYQGFDEAYYIDGNVEENKGKRILLLKDNEIFYIEGSFDLSKDENVNIVYSKIRRKS